MKIIILGSGQVGSTVAQNLAALPNNDVTVIDTDENALRRTGTQLDVQTITGNGASPAVLAAAGADDCDLLLALTRHDDTNLAACRIAADLFNIPGRIARVRQSDYLESNGQSDNRVLDAFAVTDSIHPEQLVTERITALLSYSCALQVLRFANDKARMAVVQAHSGGLLVGRPIASVNGHLPEGVD